MATLNSTEVSDVKIETSLFISENNNASTTSTIETPPSGLFISPSENVPGRPADITGYFVTASNELGKLQFSDATLNLDLGDLCDVTLTNLQNKDTLRYDSGTQMWINAISAFDAGGSDTEVQYNNAGSFDGISGITTNGTTQLNFADNSFTQFGASADLTITHNGTNSIITSSTGNLVFENDNDTGSTINRLGTATNATDFQIQDSTNATLFSVGGTGATLITGVNDTEKFVIEDISNNNVLTVDTTNNNVIGNLLTTGALNLDMVIYADQKASGVDGGTYTSGSFQTRDLNTTLYSKQTTAWASLAANQITLQAGTYYIEARTITNATGRSTTRVFNVSDTTTDSIGTSFYSTGTAAHSYISDVIVVPSAKIYEIQMRGESTVVTNGLGVAQSFTTNTYTQVHIVKIT